jgi:hypothetical protein
MARTHAAADHRRSPTLEREAIEEIRSWNDLAELGAFFGIIKVLKRIEGGGRDDAFAQLYSRLSMRLIRPVPPVRRCHRSGSGLGHP